MLDICKRLLEQSKKRGIVIPMPTDVVVATEFSAKAEADVKPVGSVSAEEMILDIGPDSAEAMAKLIASAGTILWNGPVGVFEFEQFGEGHAHARQGDCAQQGVFARRRRRHARCNREIRHRGQHFLHFDRRRRVPRIRRRQEASRRGHSGEARRMNSLLRRTKIVATLGPATDDPAVLAEIVRAGVDVVRLNFSHGAVADHARRVKLVREAARAGGPLRGRARRSAGTEDPHRPLRGRQGAARRRRRVHAGRLACRSTPAASAASESPTRNCRRTYSPGDVLLLNDGQISLQVLGHRGPANQDPRAGRAASSATTRASTVRAADCRPAR